MYTPKGEASIKVRVKRKPRSVLRKLVLSVIAIYFIVAAYGFIHDLIVSSLVKTELIKSGTIQNTIPAAGLLVRNESVVVSPRNGKLKLLAVDGERVRVGQVVAQVRAASLDTKNGETVFNITAPRAGLVSYQLDGLEDVYTQANLKTLDINKVETLEPQIRQLVSDADIEEGKPVFRIINNLDPIYIVATPDEAQKLPDQKKNTLLISQGSDNKTYRVNVIERDFAGKKGSLLLSISNYDKSFLDLRKINFSVITERFEGCVVPAGAIIQKEGKDGIFTLYKERVKWKGIEVVGRAEDKAVISGIAPDSPVVLNPGLVKEGYPLKLH